MTIEMALLMRVVMTEPDHVGRAVRAKTGIGTAGPGTGSAATAGQAGGNGPAVGGAAANRALTCHGRPRTLRAWSSQSARSAHQRLAPENLGVIVHGRYRGAGRRLALRRQREDWSPVRRIRDQCQDEAGAR